MIRFLPALFLLACACATPQVQQPDPALANRQAEPVVIAHTPVLAPVAPTPAWEATFAEVAALPWEPYAGLLRGPEGTVAAGAGNAWDQAWLLATRLREAGYTVRLARGDLADAQVDLLLATGDPDGWAASDAVRTLARAHAWVQLESADGWIDLDPTLPGLAPGEAPAPVAQTFETPDASLWQRLEVSVVQQGPEGARTLATVEGTVAELAGKPLSLLIVDVPRKTPDKPSSEDPTGLGEGLQRGIGILGAGPATSSRPPGTVVGVQVRSTLTFGEEVRELTALDRTPDAPVDERLDFVLSVPGAPPRPFRRPIPADRGHRRIDVVVLPGPVDPDDVPLADARAPQGGDDLESEASAEAEGRALGPLIARTVAAESDTLAAGTTAPVHVVHHQPRVYVVSRATTRSAESATTQVSVDLGLDEVLAVPRVGAPEGAAALYQQARGLAQSSVEGRVLEALTGVPARTTMRLMEQAATDGVGMAVLTPGDPAALDGVADLDPTDQARIRATLEAGHPVILPEHGISLDGRTTQGWWEVDPATGAFVGVLEGGGHQAVIEYSVNLAEGALDDDTAYVMGLIVGAVGTYGLIANAMIKYEFGEITPEIKKEIAKTLKGIVCSVCPSAGVSAGGGISVGNDCWSKGASSGVGAGVKLSYCDAYQKGVTCAMALVLKDLGPKVEGKAEGKIDIPLKCD